MSVDNLLAEFEVIELTDVEITDDHKSQNVNEVEQARVKLSNKLKVLRESQLEQKLEREEIKRGIDELKKSNEEKRKKEDLEKQERSKKLIDAKLAKFADYEEARRAEFAKYLRRYKEHSGSNNARRNTSELPIGSNSVHRTNSPEAESIKVLTNERAERKIRRAQSESQKNPTLFEIIKKKYEKPQGVEENGKAVFIANKGWKLTNEEKIQKDRMMKQQMKKATMKRREYPI